MPLQVVADHTPPTKRKRRGLREQIAWLRRRPTPEALVEAPSVSVGSGGTSSSQSDADVFMRDDLAVDADLVYDRLEAGARVHVSTDLEPLVSRVLSDEATLRGSNGSAKLSEWRRNGQLLIRARGDEKQ